MFIEVLYGQYIFIDEYIGVIIMNITPFNEYLLVLTDGSTIGFQDFEAAKAYINIYYYNRVKNNENVEELEDPTDSSEQLINTTCSIMGVNEGELALYKIDDVIEKIQEEFVFDEEKEEIISKLLDEHIELNVIDYEIDFILHDIDSVQIIEAYGEI